MKIQVRTLFDCSPTGVTGHFQQGKLPFADRTGSLIRNQDDWHRARNKQRNWETLLQIISLRAQPVNLSSVTVENSTWQFTFEVESAGVYSVNEDENNLDSLYLDCQGVPMMTKLDEKDDSGVELTPDKNIWFESINIESDQNHG